MEKQKWSITEKAWLIFATCIAIITVLIKSNGFISDIAVVCGIIYVILIAKQDKKAYFFGTVNVVFYGIVLFNQKIYGGAAYNILYSLPMMIYGFFHWSKSEKRKDCGIRTLHKKTKILGSMAVIIVCAGTAYVLKRFNGNLVILDSITTISGFIGIYLMTNKYMEQWPVWIIGNFTGSLMWGIMSLQNSEYVGLFIMWVIYLINSIYGAVNWRKEKLKIDKAN